MAAAPGVRPKVLFDKPGSFCRHPILPLSNGEWIFPMWYSLGEEDANKPQYGRDYSAVQISSDQGATWHEYPVPGSVRRVHMSIVETAPGRLVAFFRSRSADRIYKSLSLDYGRTWTQPRATCLPNNNASIQAKKLASGRIALVFNHYSAGDDPTAVCWPGRRSPVTIALTEDEGETFPYMRSIETGENFLAEGQQRTLDRVFRLCYYIRAPRPRQPVAARDNSLPKLYNGKAMA